MPTLTSPKTFECGLCGAGLRSQRDLDTHMCLVHDCGAVRPGGPITFRCVACREAFSRRGDLLAHLREQGHGPATEPDDARPQAGQRRRGRPRRRSG